MYPQGKEKPVTLKGNHWRGKVFGSYSSFLGSFQSQYKGPFSEWAVQPSDCVRQQSQKITDKTMADAGIGHSKLCTGEVMVPKSVNWQMLWNLYLLLCNKFLPKMSFARGKGMNKILVTGQPHQIVNKIAATGQQTSMSLILLFKWRTEIRTEKCKVAELFFSISEFIYKEAECFLHLSCGLY